MNDYENPEEQEERHENEEPEEQEKIGFTDRITGVFTEPAALFSELAKRPIKAMDWLLPLIILIVIASVSMIIVFSNPIIKQNLQKEQLAKVEENIDKQVEQGDLSPEEAKERKKQIRDSMEKMEELGPIFTILIQVGGVAMGIPFVFFVMAGIYYLFIRFIFKKEGDFQKILVPYSHASYIGVVQLIITAVLSLAMERFVQDTSVASLMQMDVSPLANVFLSKLDIFSIWSYIVIGIGFAKMYRDESTGKYMGMVFGLWIGLSLLLHFAGELISSILPMAG